MINIIKSLNYSARRDKLNWIALFTVLVLPLFAMYIFTLVTGDSLSKLTPSAYFATQLMGVMFIFTSFVIVILSCNLVAGDASDKTINYEFLAGHDRTKIFAGRMLAGFLWGGVFVYLLVLLPLAYLNFMYGWGPETDPVNVCVRAFLTLFPILRFCAFNMMLASILRSAGKGIAVGYAALMILTIVVSVVDEIFHVEVAFWSGLTNTAYLLVSQNSRNVVMDGKIVTVYDTAVTSVVILKTIGISLLFAAGYVAVAYVNFKKKDRD